MADHNLPQASSSAPKVPARQEADVLAVKPKPIVRLSEQVVNRIAAGEVIQRPASAIKELLENALDAGSTTIKVTVKGDRFFSIQDNGSGIRTDDLPLLCERHATSKLTKFEDLESIATFGFRGEALASISHVSRLTVTTRCKEEAHGWKAFYLDGKLAPVKAGSLDVKPKICAATDGTLFQIEDLFYNVPQRKKALKSASDEYARILDVCSKYAIHNAGVSIGCQKVGAGTGATSDLSTSVGATVLTNIGHVYTDSVRKQLISIQLEQDEPRFTCTGYVSGVSYNSKKNTFVLFINHRLVDCGPLEKNIKALYGALLPKGTHPFVYMSLTIDPANVDVNVHPTKKEVRFLNEDEIIAAICTHLQEKLSSESRSKSFTVQTVLPLSMQTQSNRPPQTQENTAEGTQPQTGKKRKILPQKLVRTDQTERTLDSMFATQHPAMRQASPEVVDLDQDADESPVAGPSTLRRPSLAAKRKSGSSTPFKDEMAKIPVSECSFTSVKQLRKEVTKAVHKELKDIFSKHTFVGIVDVQQGRSALQYSTGLYMINHHTASESLFYQLGLRQFGLLPKIRLKPAPSLHELLKIGFASVADEIAAEGKDLDEVVQLAADRLIGRKEMLLDYFALDISEDPPTVATLPQLLPRYTPHLDKLPMFLVRLATEVDWTAEKPCFHTFLKELAFFYSTANLPLDMDTKAKAAIEWQITHAIFPALKTYLEPSEELLPHVIQLASLSNLYKVFERC